MFYIRFIKFNFEQLMKHFGRAVQSDNSRLGEKKGSERSITAKAYLFGLLVIFASAYSQYLIEEIPPVLNLFIVYGIPVLTASLLLGSTIIRRAFKNILTALKFGLGFFGAFTVLGTLTATVVFLIIVVLDPTAVNLLNRPNPVLNIPPESAWIMVWVSLLVVGPVEEYIFRGFVHGGLLNLFKNRHWLSLAFVSSILFAAAHLYYATVYEIASLVLFTDLAAFGMAMACTYHLSGGNLLIPAAIHGLYDATGFIGVAVSLDVGTFLRVLMILVGIIVAIALFVEKLLKKRTSPPTTLP